MGTKFYKDGNAMGIATTCETSERFQAEVAQIISQLIDARCFDGDWDFQLLQWLPNIVEISGQLEHCPTKGFGYFHASGSTGDEEDVVASIGDGYPIIEISSKIFPRTYDDPFTE